MTNRKEVFDRPRNSDNPASRFDSKFRLERSTPNMATDSLQKLQHAGVDLDKLSEAHRDVLSSLSPAEVDTMISIKQRLDAIGEVEGFAKGDGNNNVGASFF